MNTKKVILRLFNKFIKPIKTLIMVARIQSIHFNADSKLIQFIENKLNELDHYLTSINTTAHAEVILKLEPKGIIKEKMVELMIRIAGIPFNVKAKGKKFEDAFVKAFHTLKRSLIKHKDKIQSKH